MTRALTGSLLHRQHHLRGVWQCRFKRGQTPGVEIEEARHAGYGVVQRHPSAVDLVGALVGLEVGGVVDLEQLIEVLALQGLRRRRGLLDVG